MRASDAERIRNEDRNNARERAAIRAIHEAAFGAAFEADLVDKLRADGHALLSLVAERELGIVGHILFSRMWIQTPALRIPTVSLAPIAVHPDHQRKGIGGQLIRHGLELLRHQGEDSVLVLGHPDYYPRFGFSTDNAKPLQSPFPSEAFMALELRAGALEGVKGATLYPPAFGLSAEYTA